MKSQLHSQSRSRPLQQKSQRRRHGRFSQKEPEEKLPKEHELATLTVSPNDGTSSKTKNKSQKIRRRMALGKRLRKRLGGGHKNKNHSSDSTAGTTTVTSASGVIPEMMEDSHSDTLSRDESNEPTETDLILASLLDAFADINESNRRQSQSQELKEPPPKPQETISELPMLSSKTQNPPKPVPMADRSTFSTNLIDLLQAQKASNRTSNQEEEEEAHQGPLFMLSSQDKRSMMEDMNVDFTETLVEQFGVGTGTVQAHLVASNHLVSQFLTVDQVVQEIGSDSNVLLPGTTQDIVFHALESFLYPRLSVLYQDLPKNDGNSNNSEETSPKENVITPKEAVELISWIDRFLNLLSTRMPQVEVMEDWKQDMYRLSDFYVETAVRTGMKSLLRRAWELHHEDDVREDAESNMITGLPEQVSYMYSQQLSTAENSVPSSVMTQTELQEKVVSICNQELATLVCDMQLKVGSEWKDISTPFFCAIINDANRLAEQSETRNEQYLTDQQEDILELGNSLVRDLTELALYATNYLCQRIMLNLCKPRNNILTSVGDESWETDESCIAMERTIATFKDFFQDLQIWLDSDYFFLKVLKTCFELTIQIYLESFFGNTMTNGVKDPEAVAEELRRDFLRLVIFFNGSSFEKYHQAGGFYSQTSINESLRILQNIAAIISPLNHPEFCHDDIVALLKRFAQQPQGGGDGSAAILHLAGLRKRHDRLESLVWVKAIASAQKAIAAEKEVEKDNQTVATSESDDDDDDESTSSGDSKALRSKMAHDRKTTVVHVPDIRNSKYIHNLLPPIPRGQPLDRDISVGTMPHAQSTLQLLESSPPRPLVMFQKAKLYTQNWIVAATTTTTTTTTVSSDETKR